MLSDVIREGESVICPKCDAVRLLYEMPVHIVVTHHFDKAMIADWVVEQEKRLGIAEPTDIKVG